MLSESFRVDASDLGKCIDFSCFDTTSIMVAARPVLEQRANPRQGGTAHEDSDAVESATPSI